MGINDFFLSIRLDWKMRLAVPCNCSTRAQSLNVVLREQHNIKILYENSI